MASLVYNISKSIALDIGFLVWRGSCPDNMYQPGPQLLEQLGFYTLYCIARDKSENPFENNLDPRFFLDLSWFYRDNVTCIFSLIDIYEIISKYENKSFTLSFRVICRNLADELNKCAEHFCIATSYSVHLQKSAGRPLTDKETYFCFTYNTYNYRLEPEYKALLDLLKADAEIKLGTKSNQKANQKANKKANKKFNQK